MLAVFAIPVLLGIGLLALLIDDDDGDMEDRVTVALDEDEETFGGSTAPGRVFGKASASEMLEAVGDDILVGKGGGHALDGGRGNDLVVGSSGNDNVFLSDGDDVYFSDAADRYDAGDDFVRGGSGSDLIADVRGSNELFGDLNDEVLLAADGLGDEGFSEPDEFGATDTLFGGIGNDALAGDDGDETTFEVNTADSAVKASYDGRAVALLRGLDGSALSSLSAVITSSE
ncbi:calcium-binding protein [Sulfitobacter sp. JB4-11]|uniref:calcium-binding protein n=1 Tax=Sulfitobacter rhodophyticola TaxID=3238304 RepID=UPI0035170DDF